MRHWKIPAGILTALMLLGLGPLGCARKDDSPQTRKQVTPVLFETADTCMTCHDTLPTEPDSSMTFGPDWRGSMMANSARDPYWQASVRRETIDHPAAASDIEAECGSCHMPMTFYEAKIQDQKLKVFSHLPAGRSSSRDDRLAVDGVSCTLCHQIESTDLGTVKSYNAGFVIDTTRPRSQRPMYGPFQVDAARTRAMQATTGYVPAQSDHLAQAELCATCHTLYTRALGPDGSQIGSLPEQVPYLEWKHSEYHGKQTCQSCHMPVIEHPAPISAVLGAPRSGVSRHTFLGGNFLMQNILAGNREELGVKATREELEAAAQRTLDHLREKSSRISVAPHPPVDGRLQIDVSVENLAGHKLPTAYPSRRAWIHLVVTDGGGHTIFESGGLSPSGAINGNINDADPTRYEPHYETISDPSEVQIYEPILGDSGGQVTTGLLRAVQYLKDNRLLPRGFDKSTAEKDIAVRGAASSDPDFAAGGDRLVYVVDLRQATGPFHVAAELLYQPIGYRWAHNLGDYDSHETTRFVSFYDELSHQSATVLAEASASSR